MQRHQELESIIAPIVTSSSLEFVGMEVVPQAKSTLLRVYIDNPQDGGVNLDDCGLISKSINMELATAPGHQTKTYILEVSSPGLDRLLFTKEQIIAHSGKKVKIRLKRPSSEGQRNYIGLLEITNDTEVTIVGDDKIAHKLSFEDIDKARVVPEWKTEGKTK